MKTLMLALVLTVAFGSIGCATAPQPKQERTALTTAAGIGQRTIGDVDAVARHVGHGHADKAQDNVALGRFGHINMNGGMVDASPDQTESWVKAATTSNDEARTALGGKTGYGLQWWIKPGAAYRAAGIFGQGIWITPELKLVVVTLSAWDRAIDPDASKKAAAMLAAIEKAVAQRHVQ